MRFTGERLSHTSENGRDRTSKFDALTHEAQACRVVRGRKNGKVTAAKRRRKFN